MLSVLVFFFFFVLLNNFLLDFVKWFLIGLLFGYHMENCMKVVPLDFHSLLLIGPFCQLD